MSVSSPHAADNPADNPASEPIRRPFVTHPGGRPRSLDDDAKKFVCELLVKGMTFKQAAAYVACDPDTIRNERKRDPHFDFNVKRARAMADITPLAVVRAASKTSWRAAAWLIDHRRRVKKEAAEARQAKQHAEAVKQEAAEPETTEQQSAAEALPPPRPAARAARKANRESFSASQRERHAGVLEAMLAILEQRSAAQGLTLDRPPAGESPLLRSEPKNSSTESEGRVPNDDLAT